MATNIKTKSRSKSKTQTEYDSVYFLKILLYLVLGSVWVAFGGHRDAPIGLAIGIGALQHERLRIDRKIEYALLLIGAVLGLVGVGITIGL